VVGFHSGARLAPTHATRQKRFEHVSYTTDLSGVPVTALQCGAGLSHDHKAQLIELYVESDPEKGFSFDRPLAELRLQEWQQDRIDGLADALVGVRRIIEFGKPELKILEVAAGQQGDLVVLGPVDWELLQDLQATFLAVLLMKWFVRQSARS